MVMRRFGLSAGYLIKSQGDFQVHEASRHHLPTVCPLENEMAGAKQDAGPHGNYVRGDSITKEMPMGSTAL